jgi:hypothetical protein
MTRVGKEVWLNVRDTDSTTLWGVVEDEAGILVEDAKHVIQRIRLADAVRRNGDEYGYNVGAVRADADGGRVPRVARGREGKALARSVRATR